MSSALSLVPAPAFVDPLEETTNLIERATASLSLAIEVGDVQSLVNVHNFSARIHELLRQRTMSNGAAKDAATLSLRAARAIGDWAAKMKPHGRNQYSGDAPGASPRDAMPSVRQMAYFREIARAAQRDERVFDGYIDACDPERDQYPTVKGFLRVVRPLNDPKHSPIIKPSDNWNFNPVAYPRIDGEEGHGYIPGDLYANAFWYFARPGEVVVDLMAGSGMALRVYEDRARWMPEGEAYDFDLRLFDLNPRGPYQERIIPHDARESIPLERAHYLFADVPYFGMVEGQYSQKSADLANQGPAEWSESIRRIAGSCAATQRKDDRVSIVSPNYSDISSRHYFMADEVIMDAFRGAGYVYAHRACASRHIQKVQTPGMARTNHQAKENRTMLTDISYILTFRREPDKEPTP